MFYFHSLSFQCKFLYLFKKAWTRLIYLNQSGALSVSHDADGRWRCGCGRGLRSMGPVGGDRGRWHLGYYYYKWHCFQNICSGGKFCLFRLVVLCFSCCSRCLILNEPFRHGALKLESVYIVCKIYSLNIALINITITGRRQVFKRQYDIERIH